MHAKYFRSAACIRTCRPSSSRTSPRSAIPRKVLDDIEGLLTENRIFKQRNVNIGVVNLADCMPGASRA